MPSNNLTSNITNKVIRVFLAEFEKNRVLSKTIDTSLLRGQFTPQFGDTVKVKRPHQYNYISTAGGDISSSDKSDLLSGSAPATVQNYITVATEWTNREEALKLDQLTEILNPAAEECVTALETLLGDFMINHAGLSYGVPGTAVDAWGDVAGAGALMQALGIPMGGEQYYVMNPFTTTGLASVQTGLSADPSRLVQTAWENAQISQNFGGLRGITSNSLSSWTNGTTADRIGALNANPNVTWVTHKDTMIQSIVIKDLTASQTPAVNAGDVLEYTGVYYIHPKTGKTVIGADGNAVKFRQTVVTGGNTDGGTPPLTGTLTVTPAAIYEANGQYNNCTSAIVEDTVVTVLGATATEYQPNLFYHKQAFGMATISLPKLYSTDTIGTTSDGISIRCSKYSDGDKNEQKIRFDLLPAFACFNPMFAGKGFGV